MATAQLVVSELSYFKQLVSAGWNGVTSARREANGTVLAPHSKAMLWTPVAIGAAAGALGTHLVARRRSMSRVAVGCAVAVRATLAWASRHFTGRAVRGAVRNVNAARDAHWLQNNPIDYA